jgi:hypothetical protein
MADKSCTRVIAYMLCVLLIAVMSLSACSVIEKAVYPHKERSYLVTENYEVSGPVDEKIYIDVDLPITYGIQRVDTLEVSGLSEYEFEEKDGYRILHGQLLGNGRSTDVSLQYKVTALSGRISWEGEVKPEYTSPGQFVDNNNPDILAMVESLYADTDMETAQNIFNFVVKHLRFDDTQNVSAVRRASQVLSSKTGVCEDYANLMVAMLRAANIPAKSISGMTYRTLTRNPGSWEHSASEGSHAWVEFFVGGQWHFADPTWGTDFFDECDGYHISYGLEPMITDESYINYTNEIEAKGYLFALSITAPFKVSVYSKSAEVTVLPIVNIILEQ